MADQRQISFYPGPKVAQAVVAEQDRLTKERDKDERVGKAEAVRSLLIRAMESVDAT